MHHLHATVIHNRPAARGYLSLRFSWPETSPVPKPGQFLTIRVSDSPVPLLRRPFAFSDTGDGWAEILYEKRGTATTLLGGLQQGDSLDLLGPLGNSFSPPREHRRPVLIGGGIGMGPVLYWSRILAAQGYRPLLIIGARDKGLIPDLDLPRGIDFLPATDDGSLGFHGTVVDCLVNYIENHPEAEHGNLELYSCGPNPMMRALHSWSRGQLPPAPLWVSMEQTMGCAVGACMGCVVKVHGEKPFARVCMEGPVFDSSLIDWEGVGHEYL